MSEDDREPDRTGSTRTLRVTGDTLTSVSSDDLRRLAGAAAIATARPRLVVCNEALRRLDRVTSAVWVVGRDEDVDSVLDHPAVSGRHARIAYDGRRFHVEDVGSTNGTFIDGEMIPPGSSHELGDGQVLRFGAIEAFFATDADDEGRPHPAGERAAAVELLQVQGRITGAARDRAEREARELAVTTGEALLLAGAIEPAEWTRALHRGEMFTLIRREATRKSRRYAWIILVQAAVIAVLLVLLLTGLGARVMAALSGGAS